MLVLFSFFSIASKQEGGHVLYTYVDAIGFLRTRAIYALATLLAVFLARRLFRLDESGPFFPLISGCFYNFLFFSMFLFLRATLQLNNFMDMACVYAYVHAL